MKRNIVIAAVTAAALAGGGTATALAVTDDGEGTARQTADAARTGTDARDDDRDDDGSDDAGEDTREDRNDDADRVAAAKVTAADAIAAALKHSPGTAVSAELDDEDGQDDQDDDRNGRAADGGDAAVVWEVGVLAGDDTWHSVRIDPASGKVLGSHTGSEDDTAQVRAALKGASVTAADAARAAAGKGTVTSVDLDEDGASRSWDVETRTSGEAEEDWNVGLRTGKVTADTADDDSGQDAGRDQDDDNGNDDA
ncbi:PepSY domain-containing protein [Streptomyces sp. ALI-76-A]|uniref:PepSY domain-containing protein n=1 Tax=Streptomyces sp. ALI-76-A TaxID=3025736 RepID=UPI00256E9D91|nr:PepSY domain-containing protein [Streptomyces sp. ALI-76-A]MDL5203856.1 PepSY domain-containing protein [Streptomyces sp. ALI-76-A]